MIDKNELHTYCAGKPGTQETLPFGETTHVFKVMGKMFALMPVNIAEDQPQRISLKCEPQLANILRQTYEAVRPGYHLNKRHWNTITIDGSIPDDEIFEMVDNSYDLVTRRLKKADQERLKAISN